MSSQFYSEAASVKNPIRHYGLFRAFISIIVISYIIITGLPLKERLIDWASSSAEESVISGLELFIAIVSGLIAIYFLLWALKNILSGIRDQANIIMTPEIPPEFSDIEDIGNSLKKKTMSVYRAPKSGPLATIRKYLSEKIIWLSRPTRIVVESNYNGAKKIVKFLIFLAILSSLSGIIRAKIPDSINLPENFLNFPYIFGIILVFAAITSIATIFALIPQSNPKADTSESIYTIKGGDDPGLLKNQLEEALISIRNNDIPNRTLKQGFEGFTGGLNDTCKFEGKILVENYPKYSTANAPAISYGYLILGAIFVLLGLYTFLPFYGINAETHYSYFWILFTAIVYSKIGSRFFENAYILLNTYRYESVIIYLELEGTFSRSEVTSGKGITDSFQSKNIVIRSDFLIRQYIAKSLTENIGIDDQRSIIGMAMDEDARNIKSIVDRTIENFRDSGVALRGIDLKSAGTSDMAKANLAYQNEIRKIHNSPQIENNKMLPNADPDINQIEE